jgi:hypothetical protein
VSVGSNIDADFVRAQIAATVLAMTTDMTITDGQRAAAAQAFKETPGPLQSAARSIINSGARK